MSIIIENEYEAKTLPGYEEIIGDIVEAALDYEGFPYECEVNVLLVDNATIHETNFQQRDIDRPTDVLSFPALSYDFGGDFEWLEAAGVDVCNPETGEIILGDIMISMDKVEEQAKEYGHSQKRELAFLVAHSMLHLMGYDHMVDEERVVMEEKQEAILKSKGYTRDIQ